MTNLPDLADPNVAQRTLLLGFSYSLTPDGSPGSDNEIIARSIRAALRKTAQHGTLPWTGVQWEIFDAIADHDQTDTFQVASLIPESRVAAPPRFDADEIAFEDFTQLLLVGATKACRMLREKLSVLGCTNLASADLDVEKLSDHLNQLQDDRNDFRAYDGMLELHDLHRMDRGSVGTEKRTLPQGHAYPNGLRRFQSHRVNRLIIEAICPNRKILKGGKYLSTKGVLDILLPQVTQDRAEIEYVLVYGNPRHSPRCKWQTEENLSGRGLAVSAVYDIHEGQDWPWDPSTAQVWCRSLDNWTDHENMVKKRL
ncbi:MAG: hypothetical protein GY751_24845 [Bacteroidetes bacterium]|nr:hypothetical protein [Bacteroidota bacterium]